MVYVVTVRRIRLKDLKKMQHITLLPTEVGANILNYTGILFADDVVIFAESLEVLVMALEALHEEVKHLEPQVSWSKTKAQMFGGLLDFYLFIYLFFFIN